MPLLPEQTWRYVRGLAVPVLLWALVGAVVARPLWLWLRGEQEYDKAALHEWIEEARVFRDSLPEMVRDYVHELDNVRQTNPKADPASELQLKAKAERIEEHLKSLGDPPTKMYPNQLPLFPVVYSLQVRLVGEPDAFWITWDSRLPQHTSPYQELEHPVAELEPPHRVRAVIYLRYQLHAYNKQQQVERAAQTRLRGVILLAVVGTALTLLWMVLGQRRERERERQKTAAQRQIDQAERLRLQEELRRREAEQHREEAERKLLEQRLATQAAEQHALELKSQLYASIGIMAGSYAHNIKNLLVRPNDLLLRCLEVDSLSANQEQMLHEVRQTLGTVTERLQQILRTVRRDPSRSELTRIDLNRLVADLYDTWADLAREKWKLTLSLELCPAPLWIEGDLSHLQQAVENLLFNARDATFEMRSHQRQLARAASAEQPADEERRQALIAAAAWRGRVVLRTRRDGDRAVLEVADNGIGMTDEVRQRCTETHYSTKRDNALYEGNSTGMGLGLSFVTVILEHHRAALAIESALLEGTTFRVSFPPAVDPG
jgi:signal transduction histidine kinase